MTEKTKVIYVADDGVEFVTKEECLAHEKEVSHITELKKALKEVREFCKKHYCSDCPFAIGGNCFAEDPYSYDGDEHYVEPQMWQF